MDDYTFEKRKKVINELIHDKYYTPMKGKEIAMLLNVSKENRNDLYKVLDALVLFFTKMRGQNSAKCQKIQLAAGRRGVV